MLETPPPGIFKLNFDGSVKCYSAAAGAIIRDHEGNLVAAKSYNLGVTPIMIAEVMGLRNGLLLALQQNISRILIEGDNMLVINAIKNIWKIPSKLDFLIRDIQQLMSKFTFCEIHHIYREANQVADWIANIGHLLPNEMSIFCQNYSKLKKIVNYDALGMTFVRKGS